MCNYLNKKDDFVNLTLNILELLNQDIHREDIIKDIVFFIKDFTKFDAIGIRLQMGEDYPYYSTMGFSDEFIDLENSLCKRDNENKIITDENGYPCLSCMCGTVIRGKTDISYPFFTKGGSFWSNNTTSLLRETTDEDRQSETRNRCNGFGYESVSLIPLKFKNKNIGLLQINDRRKNMFTLKIVSFFERLGESIGIAIGQKLAMEELKNKNEELERFSYTVSHDLQEPLRTVISYCQLLKKDYENQYIDYILNSSQRMKKLIKDLLSFSEIGNKNLVCEKNDLNLIIEEIKCDYSSLIVENGVTIKSEELPVLMCNYNNMKQLFSNLISNAIKFRRKKEDLIVEIFFKEKGDFWEFCVKDNGIGIDSKYFGKIFGVFERLYSKKEYPGTGIGLSICKKIIDYHKGKIWIKSTEGKGSEFYFTILKNNY
jgi:signal transduction histidine kinase